LRFGDAKRLRDDVLGMSLERVEPCQRSKTSIARKHGHTRARHERIHTLSRKIFTVGKVARISRRLEFAFGPHAVAVAEIGERRRLDEHQSAHGLRRLVSNDELVSFDAQVGVGITRVRLSDDDAFNNRWLGLIVVRGKRRPIKARLREVVAKRAKNRREHEDKEPSRFGRAPPEDDAEKRRTRRQAERDGRQRDARCNPNADESGEREGDERQH